MPLANWQIGLRQQAAQAQPLVLKKIDDGESLGEHAVTNRQSGMTYRVVIRSLQSGENFCACPDYSVNTLGTCKHIEFALHRLRRRHAALLEKGYLPPYPEVYLRYGEQRELVFSPGTVASKQFVRYAKGFFHIDGTIIRDRLADFDDFLREAPRVAPDLRIYEDARAYVARIRDDAARGKLLRARYPKSAESAWKGLLKTELFPYQREGALFAACAGRAIIADEMGLGKTIQAIGAAEMLARHCCVERVLVVCPSSLKYQWEQEIAKFAERSCRVIEGFAPERRRRYADDTFFKMVNYDVVHRDLEQIEQWRPDLVILDEAQRIKNWQTRAAKTVKRIESPFAIVLTGTPLENRLEELHSITEFVDRFRLGPLFAFKAAHEIAEGNTNKVTGYRDLHKVRTTLAPILIRRTKQAVLSQLPGRTDKNFFVPMTDEQWLHHDENKDVVAMLVNKWQRYGFLSESDQLRLRISLQSMRMACDSTYLVDHQTRDGRKVNELECLLDDIFEEPDAKVVIFSQWLRMNELVADMLADRKWGHVSLHGGIASRKRPELIRALKEEPDCRVFLSTDAGGTGLNLQRASCVINMDLPWNPAVLEQRIGRVHRLGQQRAVRVVNFVAEGTIEHGMLSLLSFKRSMFAGVLDGGDDTVMMGGSAMKRFINTVQSATSAIPATQGEPGDPIPGGVEKMAESEGQGTQSDLGATDELAKRVSQFGEGRLGAGSGAHGNRAGIALPAQPGFDLVAALSRMDQKTVGAIVEQAGQWLGALGRALVAPPSQRGGESQRVGPLSVDVDRDGERELRIRLPDDKRIGELLTAFGRMFGST